jgi:molecular chaperone DnaK
MSEMINFGIDLGTTNSLVAKFNKGTVEVFTNPIGFKETLPSIVGFRNDRILVGEQARAFVEKDPKSVVGRFKRKMGTTESFKIKALSQSKTPIELSAFVLKELKTFIHTGETPEAAVITIPASFDMVQANATKEAGHAAGFKQVVLLQEPIAASLAYANKEKNLDLKNSQWMVYDLGGGTFDVALVKIVEGELKIVDHEGDNYLGGADFDTEIVKRFIAPWLENKGQFADLLGQMTSESGKHNRLWYHLLRLAEDAKIELSTRTSADIEFSVEDEGGNTIDALITLTRTEYEAIIKDAIDSTAEMLKKILTRNSLRPQDLKFVLMVGGSTYTPFVRKRVEELLGIPVNTGINPTNAIAVGAAYFAATKEINLGAKSAEKTAQPGTLRIKVSYNRASQEHEEMFAARVEGSGTGLFYRITRADGGYDSGLKKLTARILEDLPLQENAYNSFALRIYDTHNNPVPTDFDSIQISQGKYSIAGQPLPEDLSLVVDDIKNEDTRLDEIFLRNTVLPAKRKFTKEASKTLRSGTEDEIRIRVVEGPSTNHPDSNKQVGQLVIPASGLQRDIVRGTDIELEFEVSESRILSIKACVTSSGQEYSNVCDFQDRNVSVEVLAEEIELLEKKLEKEQTEAIECENYEVADQLKKLRGPVQELHDEAMLLAPDDVTDHRYQLEDKKRKIAQGLGHLTSGKRLDRLRNDYQKAKEDTTAIVNNSGNDHERQQLHEVVAREQTFLHSTIPQKLEAETDRLRGIGFQILRRTPKFLIDWFEYFVAKCEVLNDQVQSKALIEAGKKHIEANDYDKLEEVNRRLYSLLPQLEKDSNAAWFPTEGIR